METQNVLLVDAGATKTEFVILDAQGGARHFFGKGINPNYLNDNEILQIFNSVVQESPDFDRYSISQISYYGAGCASLANARRMVDLLANFFSGADIRVYSDLMSVCHALCRSKPGLVAILGTGSASCFYDGQDMVQRAPSLGYLLGDEGSGTDLGKRLLTAFLYGQMPHEIATKFQDTYNLTSETILHKLYKEPDPNLFMSSFAPFLLTHIGNSFIHEMAYESFFMFFAKLRFFYRQAADYYWYFSGSVAFNFRDLIREAATVQGLMIGNVVASPMPNLIDYYKNSILCNK